MELIGGEVVTMSYGGYPHETTKSNLIEILAVWLVSNRTGKLYSETMFRLDNHNSPIPDVSIVSLTRIKPGSTGHLQGSPEIAIEVVSSETADALESKIDLYLACGSKSVWVVFPQQRVVRIFDASGLSRKFEQSQIFEDPIALPGFSTPVSAIFEGI
jgi:Uma2 family endonuclease